MKLTVAPKCPACQVRDGIRRIVYGAVPHSADASRYVVAPSDASAGGRLWACVECGWQMPTVMAQLQEMAESLVETIAESPLFDQDATDTPRGTITDEPESGATWLPTEGGFAVA